MTRHNGSSQSDRSRDILLQAIYNRLQQVDQRLINMEHAMSLRNEVLRKSMARPEDSAAHGQAVDEEAQPAQPETREGFNIALTEVLERRIRPLYDSEIVARSRSLLSSPVSRAVGDGFQAFKAAALSLSQDLGTLVGDAFDDQEVSETGAARPADLAGGSSNFLQRARDAIREKATESLLQPFEDDDGKGDINGLKPVIMFDARAHIAADVHDTPPLSPSSTKYLSDSSYVPNSIASASMETPAFVNPDHIQMTDIREPDAPMCGRRAARLQKKQRIITAAQARNGDSYSMSLQE
ncbi:hypothetical protein ACHAQA_005312 [Verticillium albo-atrum]